MQLLPITKAATLPVNLAEMKAHLRVAHSDEDLVIAACIAAATEALDGKDGLLSRALILQSWRLLLDSWTPDQAIPLPLPPLISVIAVTAGATGQSATVIPNADYGVGDAGSPDGGIVVPVPGKKWPVFAGGGALWLDFTCGYGVDGTNVPAAIKQAIMLHAASLFESRESVLISATGAKSAMEVPHGYSDLIEPYRARSFGDATPGAPRTRVVLVGGAPFVFDVSLSIATGGFING
jgi:uncharacterized phiE125 gp8 family phage protein